MQSLPNDLIVFGIFSRLPIKATIQCKAVCRTWYKLLKDPNFTKNYEKNPPFTSLLVSLYVSPPSTPDSEVGLFMGVVFYLLEISKNGDSCIQTPINPKIPHWSIKDPRKLLLQDSRHGLFCLSYLESYSDDIEDVYISNPITEEIIQLPRPKNPFGDHCRLFYPFCYHCRLGYSSATNQFKVLRVYYKVESERDKVKFEIFTIGVDVAWRCLPEGPSMYLEDYTRGVTLNGVYHWILLSDRTKWIYTFDFSREKYGRISSPPSIKENRLRVLNDHHLCVISSHDPLSKKITVWTMKEYGVSESWTKDVILNPAVGSLVIRSVVAKLDSGDYILLSQYNIQRQTHVISINTKLKRCREVEILGANEVPEGRKYINVRASIYFPSFSSIRDL